MKHTKRWRLVLVWFVLGLSHSLWAALPRVSIPFADSMVLQRHQPMPIWGKDAPGVVVTARFHGQTQTARTTPDSTWQVEFPAMLAGGPYTLQLSSNSGTTSLKGVMIGEVWNCAGQSNMDTRLSHGEYPQLADTIKRANHPRLRFLTLRQPGQAIRWQTVTPQTAGGLSAAGYFFGREILDHHDTVTVGLLVTAVGGTTVESWWDTTTAKQFPGVPASGSWKVWGAPVAGYALRGTVWLQGENNTSSALYQMYGTRLKAMIEGWRTAWKQPNMPFIVGSLAGKGGWQTAANEKSNAASIREQQRRLCDTLPNTWYVPLLDLGDSASWHYPQKSQAGRRLGRVARGAVYRDSLVWKHSTPKQVFARQNRLVVVWETGESPLRLDSGTAPVGFAVAGKDNVWMWATGNTLKGDTVYLTSNVAIPTQVRHAWGNRPLRNLRNQAGLPATSFWFPVGSTPIQPPTQIVAQAKPLHAFWNGKAYHLAVPLTWKRVSIWNMAQGKREQTLAVRAGVVVLSSASWSSSARLLQGPDQKYYRVRIVVGSPKPSSRD